MPHPLLVLFVAALAVAACTSPPAATRGSEVLPVLGLDTLGTVDGLTFVEGGVSGLDRDPAGGLIGVTDRGPNADAVNAAGRPAKRFPLPGYRPALLRLAVGAAGVSLTERVPFIVPTGTASGLPVPDAAGAEVVESAFDAEGRGLAPDAWGVDAEGVAAVADGYWVSEEYRPSLWYVGRDGTVRQRYTPRPVAPGDRPLPAVILDREANRGFEGVGVWPSGHVVAALQSPLLVGGGGSRVARLVVLDPASGDAWTLAYELDGPLRKVGDVAALDEGRLLVVEHGPMGLGGPWSGAVYLLDTRRAGRVPDGVTPETGNSVRLADKSLVLDLGAAGWPAGLEKPEGLAVLDDRTLAVVNDNDYGLGSPLGDGQLVATDQPTVLVRFRLAAALPGVSRKTAGS